MHRTRQELLPFVGMSHQFIGAENGNVAMCSYLVNAPPGRGPVRHTHPYDKVVFVQEGHGRWFVNSEEHDVGPGDILVIKAGEVHTFVNNGDVSLKQMDVHLSPRFIQENLE